ncbi:uncharacterized protein [Henckelia pumila]|uniref:uncharacterized protein n=1 Tax=Henckelia pumila TaxID=405737 RepID=UPI0027A9AFBD|nr:MYB111-like protein [Henckelia pumila]
MGRTPCCEKTGLNKGKWTAEEDEKLISYIKANGDGSWRSLPKNAGLLRCGKSCRLRWMNYLRDDVKRGMFTEEEDVTIVKLHKTFGNKWSLIASHLPGRTDNEIKNYWNSHLSRRIYRYRSMGGLTEADLIKIMTGAAYKKPRAAPKKYSSAPKNAHSHDTAADEIHGNAEENESNYRMGEDKESYPFENKEAGGVNTSTGWLHGSKLFASPNEVIEGDDLGQWGPVDEDIIMHVEQFLEEEDKMAVDEKGSVSERECVEGRLNIENMGIHACFSPTIPYYNDEELGWDHVNGGEEEFHLWNFGEEGDILYDD